MNKTFNLFGIIFVVVMIILALLDVNKSGSTDWRKNFELDKKTPFGLFVFNNEVKHLLKNKLKKTTASPYDYFKKNDSLQRNILIVQSEIDLESWAKILQKIESGSDALIIAEDFHPEVADSLGFSVVTSSFRLQNIIRLTERKFYRDSIIIDRAPTNQGFAFIQKNHQILGNAQFDGGKVNFIKINKGKGHLYLLAEPLVLTNYYLLKPGNERYVEDVFSYLPDRETVWFLGDNGTATESRSPLNFILSKPALRYAWYLLLGGLLLFVIFNAKRKQRIIPILEPLKNKSVEFVKSISNLYLQEGDFHDMMAKKAHYFLSRVRTDLLINTQTLDENFAETLQLKTGKNRKKIDDAIDLIRRGQDPYANVMKEELVKMNTLLDEILR